MQRHMRNMCRIKHYIYDRRYKKHLRRSSGRCVDGMLILFGVVDDDFDVNG